MPDLTDEDIQFIRELREKHEDGKVNRRQALGMLGAAGVGAAGGFLGTGSAAADPSTSDSDGNVGLPSDRVDVFADGIDSNSVSTEKVAFTGITDGETNLIDEIDESGLATGYTGYSILQRELGVSTTATAIFTSDQFHSAGIVGGGHFMVGGRRQGSSEMFTDIVHFDRANSPEVVNDIPSNAPDGRSYTRSVGSLDLAMAANTYNVVVIGFYATTEN